MIRGVELRVVGGGLVEEAARVEHARGHGGGREEQVVERALPVAWRGSERRGDRPGRLGAVIRGVQRQPALAQERIGARVGGGVEVAADDDRRARLGGGHPIAQQPRLVGAGLLAGGADVPEQVRAHEPEAGTVDLRADP